MQNSVSNELNVLLGCGVLGVICGIVFDVFKAARFGKRINTVSLVLQDVIYYCIISVVIFVFILKINGADIRGYMPVSAVLSFVIYRATLSRWIVRTFILMIKMANSVIKMMLKPVIFIYKILIWPFFWIKTKLLSKNTKIALTFKQICFKIKYNVGMICNSKLFCKERKPCRRKQKPEKRV